MQWFPSSGLTVSLAALVGMSAMFTGASRAFITSIIFALEITGQTNALLPLLATCSASYIVSFFLMKNTIMTEKISRRGLHIYREYSVDPQERVFVEEVMTSDVVSIPADLPLDAVEARYFGQAQLHRAFPVVDANGIVLGMLDRALLQKTMAGPAHASLATVFDKPAAHALPTETCQAVARRMAVLHLERLPVVHDQDEHKLLGIISRSDLVKPTGISFLEEHVRERLMGRRRRPAS
jgi:CBS domain-containing protein